MIFEIERLAVDDADAFKHAIAIEVSAVARQDGGCISG
jgi:hypothetical protein